MYKQLIGIVALAACVALPAELRAQGAGSVCKDGSTSTTTGMGACSSHGGVDTAATTKAHRAKSKSGVKKAVDNSEKAVSKAAENTGKAVKTGAKATGKGATVAAKATANVATKGAKAVAKGATNAKNAVTGKDKTKDNDKDDAKSHDATGATAKCKDGTFSHRKEHPGACSKHGGVDKWMDGSTP